MPDEDSILHSSVVYSEEEILAEFQECCESEAEMPGHYTERLKLAAEDLCQMLSKPRSAGYEEITATAHLLATSHLADAA